MNFPSCLRYDAMDWHQFFDITIKLFFYNTIKLCLLHANCFFIIRCFFMITRCFFISYFRCHYLSKQNFYENQNRTTSPWELNIPFTSEVSYSNAIYKKKAKRKIEIAARSVKIRRNEFDSKKKSAETYCIISSIF